jgi:hypothetical protein
VLNEFDRNRDGIEKTMTSLTELLKGFRKELAAYAELDYRDDALRVFDPLTVTTGDNAAGAQLIGRCSDGGSPCAARPQFSPTPWMMALLGTTCGGACSGFLSGPESQDRREPPGPV